MQVPEICKLNADTTMQEVLKKAPFYVPEWNIEDEKDLGIVLSNIFSRMVDLISSNLNEALKKHFLSFLEMINASLIPSSPARVPLTFVLSNGVSEDVLIKAYTQASGDDNGKTVIFETEKNFFATPSKLVSVYSVIKEKDKIIKNTDAIDGVQFTELFAGDSLQKHTLYIGDERLFNVHRGQISIEFKVEKAKEAELRKFDAKQGIVEWMHSVESIEKKDGKEIKKTEWQPLKTIFNPKDKRLILNTGDKPIDKVKLNGIESRWLKCQLKDSKIEDLKNFSIRNVLTSPFDQDGITPDFLFYNDIPIDPNSASFYPFGKKPYLYDTFYIASKDAFSKKGYKITLKFGLKSRSSKDEADKPKDEADKPKDEADKPKDEADKPQLSWEFWDGESWNLLPIQGDEWKKNLSEELKVSESNKANKPKERKSPIYDLMISEMPEVKITRVNGKENYWIRVRLVGGNYGKEYEIVSSNETKLAEVVPSGFFPPEITNLKINYNVEITSSETENGTDYLTQPEYIYAENNLVFRNCLGELEKQKLEEKEKIEEKKCFKPFQSLPDTPPAVYFGFDRELKKGPFSLFINIDESIEYPESFLPKIKWEYLIDVDLEIWEELEVLDETAGFTKKGMVQFTIPRKTLASQLFDSEKRYWIRAVITGDFFDTFNSSSGDLLKQVLTSHAVNNVQLKTQEEWYKEYIRKFRPATYSLIKDSINTKDLSKISEQAKLQESYVPAIPECRNDFEIYNINFASENDRKLPPKVRGFYLNSVWGLQSRTIHDEIVGSGTGEVNKKFKLVNAPVINEEIWVNEVTTLSEKERKTLRAEASNVKLIQDNKGNITEFWVRWTRVNDFLDSKNKDRHYIIDKTDGEVCFGDGKHGMTPPIGSDNIKATYSIGGGRSGNLDALKISKLQSSISFVDKVSNPTSSSGGTETEDIDTFLERAPTILKNRNRAVATEDYEWLAKEASEQVARVKALPNFKSEGESSAGMVTVVIVPESSNSKPVPSSELKRRVTSYLKERSPAMVTLRVIPPYYVKADISAELITTSIDAIPIIEKDAKEKISEFLHPLTGSANRKGWSFGCALCVSDIYSILEHIKNVDYVNKVIINLYDDSGITGSSMRLNDKCAKVKLPEYALPYSGEHDIRVKFKNSHEEG